MAPVLHNNEPLEVVDNFELPQLSASTTTGIPGAVAVLSTAVVPVGETHPKLFSAVTV